jgi:hypothetical protein
MMDVLARLVLPGVPPRPDFLLATGKLTKH